MKNNLQKLTNFGLPEKQFPEAPEGLVIGHLLIVRYGHRSVSAGTNIYRILSILLKFTPANEWKVLRCRVKLIIIAL